MAEGFKNALACWCSGVSVVTTSDAEGRMYGLTVSSFSSVSLDPPLVLVCIDNRNRFPAMVAESGRFTVSVLQTGQEAASNHFASSGREPTTQITEVAMEQAANGQPVVAGSMAWISCELHESVLAGDHTIVIGRVVETFASEGDPLLYYRRGYRTATD